MRYAGWRTRNSIVKCPGSQWAWSQAAAVAAAAWRRSDANSEMFVWTICIRCALQNIEDLFLSADPTVPEECRVDSYSCAKEWRVGTERMAIVTNWVPAYKGSRIWTSPDANKQTLRNSRLPIFRGFWDGLLLDTSTYRTPVNMHRYSSACPVSCNKSDSVVVHRSYPLLDHFFVSWPHCSFCRHVRVQLQCRHPIRHKPQITFKFFLYEWIRGKCLAPCPWFMADQDNSGGSKGCHPNL